MKSKNLFVYTFFQLWVAFGATFHIVFLHEHRFVLQFPLQLHTETRQNGPAPVFKKKSCHIPRSPGVRNSCERGWICAFQVIKFNVPKVY